MSQRVCECMCSVACLQVVSVVLICARAILFCFASVLPFFSFLFDTVSISFAVSSGCDWYTMQCPCVDVDVGFQVVDASALSEIESVSSALLVRCQHH